MSTQTIPTSPQPAFAPSRRAEFKVIQPPTTYTGSPITPVQKGLPRTTQSLCPECSELIEAMLIEDEGRVYMEKTCAAHGRFRDLISPDVQLYLKMENWHFGDNRGLKNPAIPNATRCPDDCGLCSMHTSHTVLANVDLTNRCNLTCPSASPMPTCRATSTSPTFDHVRRMLQALRDEQPVAERVVQFSGGEPTIHPQFFEICAMARDMGFSHIQAATNGIMLADLEFAQKAKEAGLHHALPAVRRRHRRHLPPHARRGADGKEAGLHRELPPGRHEDRLRAHHRARASTITRSATSCAWPSTTSIASPASAFSRSPSPGASTATNSKPSALPSAIWAHAMADQTGIFDPLQDWFPLSCVSPFSQLASSHARRRGPHAHLQPALLDGHLPVH